MALRYPLGRNRVANEDLILSLETVSTIPPRAYPWMTAIHWRDRYVAHLEQELIDAILDRIRAAIASLPEGSILASSEAFTLADEVIDRHIAGHGIVMTEVEFRRWSRDIHYTAYQPARLMVAAQLRGLTLQDLISITEKGAARFLDRAELKVMPKPTQAFSGYCEPHDPWNLLSNAFHAERAAREIERNSMTADDIRLMEDLKRAHQLLFLVSQQDVLAEDIDGKPYNGTVREPQWVPATRRSSSEVASSA